MQDTAGEPVPGARIDVPTWGGITTDPTGLAVAGPYARSEPAAVALQSVPDDGRYLMPRDVNRQAHWSAQPELVEYTVGRSATLIVTVDNWLGLPLAGAQIYYTRGDSSYGQASWSGVLTGEECRIEGVAPGDLELVIRFGPESRYVPWRNSVHIRATGGVHAVLATPETGEGLVEGVVVDAEGSAVRGMHVMVLSQRGWTKTAISDAAGRFTVQGIQGDAVEVRPLAHGLRDRNYRYFGTFDAPGMQVSGSAMRGVVLRLEPGCIVRGRVQGPARDGPRSVYIDRQQFASTGWESVRHARDGADGEYEFRHLWPGRYVLWPEGREDLRTPVTVGSELGARDEVTLDFRLR